jgi:hypothetical protein
LDHCVPLVTAVIKKGIWPSTPTFSHAVTISLLPPRDLHLLTHIDSSP